MSILPLSTGIPSIRHLEHYVRASLPPCADIPSIRHRVHHARAGLQSCASIPKPDESIQSKAILKILDMFFALNRQRRLQTIHYYVISKIVDIESLVTQEGSVSKYPAFKKRSIFGYALTEINL